jgi:hypothetical protein
MIFSKSLYTTGIQCSKALWLKKYKSEVLAPVDASAETRFKTGHTVGELACDLFPNGVKVDFNPNLEQMVKETKKLLDSGVTVIYEAAFSFKNTLVIVDIFEIDSDGISIYEVKSSTSLKDIYLHDVSIQYYTLQNLGYKIKSANVVYLNSNYVRGDELDIKELFVVEDVTQIIISLKEAVPTNLQIFQTYLADRETEPNIDIGKHCKNPYECLALDYCWRVQRNIPDYSVFNIFNLGSKKQIELYSQGIVDVDDIPDNFEMTVNQKAAIIEGEGNQIYMPRIENSKDYNAFKIIFGATSNNCSVKGLGFGLSSRNIEDKGISNKYETSDTTVLNVTGRLHQRKYDNWWLDGTEFKFPVHRR